MKETRLMAVVWSNRLDPGAWCFQKCWTMLPMLAPCVRQQPVKRLMKTQPVAVSHPAGTWVMLVSSATNNAGLNRLIFVISALRLKANRNQRSLQLWDVYQHRDAQIKVFHETFISRNLPFILTHFYITSGIFRLSSFLCNWLCLKIVWVSASFCLNYYLAANTFPPASLPQMKLQTMSKRHQCSRNICFNTLLLLFQWNRFLRSAFRWILQRRRDSTTSPGITTRSTWSIASRTACASEKAKTCPR